MIILFTTILVNHIRVCHSLTVKNWILFIQTCEEYDLGRIRFYRATLFVKLHVSFSLILVYFDSTVWETILPINVRT